MSTLFPSYPPALDEDSLQDLKVRAIDWALAHGLVIRPLPSAIVKNEDAPDPTSLAVHAPISLFPSPFPTSCYDQAVNVQTAYNKLYFDLSLNSSFIHGVMTSLVKVDDFQARLYDIFQKLEKEGNPQPLSLGLFRSDYILHAPAKDSTDDGIKTAPASIKQVEFNTISVSFGGLSTLVTRLHQYLRDSVRFNTSDHAILSGTLPSNDAIAGLGSGIADAHHAYVAQTKVAKAQVLMMVQDGERNAFDQKVIEFCLWQKHGIMTHRVSLTQFASKYHVDTKKLHKPLLSASGTEISVVYFRSGYGPEDYKSEKEWNARKTIELSGAIKCPTVAMQLVGAKKVQQLLAVPGEVEKYVSESEATKMRSTFTGLYPLDGTEQGEKATKMALSEPRKYVMKPQREGGGHNVYREKIVPVLSKLTTSEREAYILMDLIEPPPLRNTLLKQGHAVEGDIVSELGIFGVVLGDQNGIQVNRTAGHLLRTKGKEHEEGGVAVGFAVVDSPLLI